MTGALFSPWGRRMVGWGLRRALWPARASMRWTFLSGVGVGAGLMYLLGHVAPASGESPRAATPRVQKGGRPAAGRRRRPASRAKTG